MIRAEVTMENYAFQVIEMKNGKFVIKLFEFGSFKGYYGRFDPIIEEDTITSRLVSTQNDAQAFNARADATMYGADVLNLVEQL